MDKNIKAGEEILRVEGLKKYFPVRGKERRFRKSHRRYRLRSGERRDPRAGRGVGLRKEHYCLQRGGNGNHD